MTSKISFSKMLRDEMKQMSWLTILQLVVFILLIPFRILLILSSRASEIVKYNMEWDLVEIFCESVGFDQTENAVISLAAGILIALIVFGYLHSAAKLDFLHSLPLKRERLFAIKYVSGTLSFVIAYGCSQILTLLVGLCYGAVNGTAVLELFAAFLLEVLHFLASFSCTVLAVMLTGKILTTVCAIGVFALYVPMIFLLKTGMQEFFLENLFLRSASRGYVLTYSSPWAFGLFHSEVLISGKEGMTGMWPTMSVFCQLVAMAAIPAAAAVLLYRIRRTESAGSALAFKKTEGVIKLMLTIPAALCTAIVAHEMLTSIVWEALFILIFGTLGCLIMELIYRWDIRQVLSQKRHLLITFVAATVIFCVFRFDLTGQNTYLPEKGEVESMAIKDNYMYFRYNLGEESEQAWAQSIDETLLDYLETDNWEPIYEVAKNGVGNTGIDHYTDECYVYVKFRLKNGKEIYRNYWVDTELYEACMNQMLEDDTYRERYFPILTWEEQDGNCSVDAYLPKLWLYPDEEIHEYESDFLWIEVPSDRLAELITAYQEDLRSADYGDMMWSSGSLEIHYRDWGFDQYELTADFVNTLEVLRDIQ